MKKLAIYLFRLLFKKIIQNAIIIFSFDHDCNFPEYFVRTYFTKRHDFAVEFSEELNCTSDMLLHFPFDDHFNDVTCTGAISTVHGDVSIENDAMRGNVACFNGTDHLVVSYACNIPICIKMDIQFRPSVSMGNEGCYSLEQNNIIRIAFKWMYQRR